MSLKHFRPLALALLLGLPAAASAQVFVDASATGAGNGSSWANAYTSLANALVDNPGAEIWVARGVYVPPPFDAGGDRRIASFSIPPGTRVYGGFAGGESAREQRNIAANPTVLSGDLDGDDVVDSRGVTLSPLDARGENAHQVVLFDAVSALAAIGPDTVLDGFIITAGRADSGLGLAEGAGAKCIVGFGNEHCSPTLSNLEFRGNAAALGGGAFAMIGGEAEGNPHFINVVFAHNHAAVDGEGQGMGGAVFLQRVGGEQRMAPVFENVRFEHNFAVQGGAIHVKENVDLRIDRARFINNRVDAVGDTSLFFVQGGAIYLYGGFSEQASLRVSNSLFFGNESENLGGVAYSNSDGGDATLEFVNVTASGNRAVLGGVLYQNGVDNSVTRFHNSILWANTATQQADPDSGFFPQGGGHSIYAEQYGGATGHRFEFASTLIQHGLSAPAIVYDAGFEFDVGQPFPPGMVVNQGGNQSANPQFVGASLYLAPTSPAVDAGSNALNATPLDLDGNPRIQGGIIDLGAFEYFNNPCSPGLTDTVFCDGFE